MKSPKVKVNMSTLNDRKVQEWKVQERKVQERKVQKVKLNDGKKVKSPKSQATLNDGNVPKGQKYIEQKVNHHWIMEKSKINMIKNYKKSRNTLYNVVAVRVYRRYFD